MDYETMESFENDLVDRKVSVTVSSAANDFLYTGIYAGLVHGERGKPTNSIILKPVDGCPLTKVSIIEGKHLNWSCLENVLINLDNVVSIERVMKV